MARKHRVRSRRSVEAARRASAPREATTYAREPARTSPRPSGTSRTRYGARAGTGRAVGPPSAALERAAASERAFVMKDFRRMSIVVVIALLLLVASGVILRIVEP